MTSKLYLCACLFGVGLLMVGCSGSVPYQVTRTETDHYTITTRDTTINEQIRNNPGSSEDNGVVFPSSKTRRIYRETMSYDSSHDRSYPAFLRFGGLEFASTLTGAPGPGHGAGFLGVYSLFDSTVTTTVTGEKEKMFFQGHILRIIPIEYPLRWFNDAPDWTWGMSAYENIAQNNDANKFLTSIAANLYIRKRFWLRDIKPFVIFSPFVGISAVPSAYINLGGELTLGSYGGFNIRAYAGVAYGFTWEFYKSNNGEPLPTIITPYIGLGVSALDFINKPSDLLREWKDYSHSAVELSILNIEPIYATAGYPNLFDTATVKIPITGITLELATAHFPLSNLFNGKFWAGTTLFKLFAPGYNQQGFSVLPLRFGYREYLFAEDLTIEPQIELSYYPSQIANLSAKLKLNMFNDFTLGFTMGYASGSPGAFLPGVFSQVTNNTTYAKELSTFNTFYFGITFGIKDRYYTPQRVKEMEEWSQ
jgi:hypothetical protein